MAHNHALPCLVKSSYLRVAMINLVFILIFVFLYCYDVVNKIWYTTFSTLYKLLFNIKNVIMWLLKQNVGYWGFSCTTGSLQVEIFLCGLLTCFVYRMHCVGRRLQTSWLHRVCMSLVRFKFVCCCAVSLASASVFREG